ncbi:MAG TPA: ABC transporter substrate-binding protein [Vicinamibacterales bacterium]|nr:ABC transporter substrate-binding protein [Vicinamibacterales bacterium]
MKHTGFGPDTMIVMTAAAAFAAATLSCRNGESAAKGSRTTVLRIGLSLGNVSLRNPGQGIRQIGQNITTEGLARTAEDGRMEPQLADRWQLENGGQTIAIDLKPDVRFQDGTAADAAAVAAILTPAIRNQNGPVADDIESVRPVGANRIEIRFRRPSPLMLEALEAPITKPGSNVSTGPFVASASSSNEWVANATYHLGRPAIDAVTARTFPSVRSAWAELLRNNIDMLYEVGSEALDSLENATNVSVFTFTRRYQYVFLFDSRSSALSHSVRQAINLAIDRSALVQSALNGHGVPSAGPLWPKHWAVAADAPAFEYAPKKAAELTNGKNVRLKCLMPADPLYERVALELKKQLAAVGVDVEWTALPPDDLITVERQGSYDAVLTELISGPTPLRLYNVWNSKGSMHIPGRGNTNVDVALDRLPDSTNEDDYRKAVRAVQQAFVDDPPAAFLNWTQRARAVSRRFIVPQPEPGRDILATLRLWTPSNDQRVASRK